MKNKNNSSSAQKPAIALSGVDCVGQTVLKTSCFQGSSTELKTKVSYQPLFVAERLLVHLVLS